MKHKLNKKDKKEKKKNIVSDDIKEIKKNIVSDDIKEKKKNIVTVEKNIVSDEKNIANDDIKEINNIEDSKNEKKKNIVKDKKNNKKDKIKRVKLEEDDFFNDIQDILKNADYDKKTLEQKIDLAWLDSKKNFVNLIRQKNMYNKISLLFNKGSPSTKYDIVNSTLKNIVQVSSHEHSRQFIITLAKDNKKYLVLLINKLKEVSREITCNRNGLYVLDEVYKMANRKCRGELVLAILDLEELPDSEEHEHEGDCCGHGEESEEQENDQELNEQEEKSNEQESEEQENDEIFEQVKGETDEELNEQDLEEEIIEQEEKLNEENDEEEINEEEDDLQAENASLIRKLSSKRLWKYDIAHHLLLEYLTIYPLETAFILDLLVRNKQMKLILQTYKGLEACIKLLNRDTIKEILRIISPDFINIVNNEYGIIYILKIMELDTENNTIIDLYTENYKEIFINEGSVLPLLYIFNQERKYYPTLFNQLRSRELFNIDKTYLLSKYKEILVKHIKVFMKSFSWILVYFFSKKDEDIKKLTIKMIKEIEMNEYSEKLKKKMIKYKLMKE